MNRIDKKFIELKAQNKKAFIAYITGGYPYVTATKELVLLLEKCGVDIIEIGVPFSDPIADGPIIQHASEAALSRGVTLKKLLITVKDIRQVSSVPIVFMSYYNPVYRYGVRKFVADASKCGVDGVIIPDLPPEESAVLMRAAKRKKFSVIFLAAPTTTRQRLAKIAKKSGAFIYYVSLTGVTGTRRNLTPGLLENIKRIKNITGKPVCAGFGISNAIQAGAVAHAADGVIVGSAIINIIENLPSAKALERKVAKFTLELAKAIHHPLTHKSTNAAGKS